MAEPVPFKEANVTLGAPPGSPNVLELSVYRGEGLVVSKWRLTEPEIAEIVRTGFVWVSVVGRTTPPLAVHAITPFK